MELNKINSLVELFFKKYKENNSASNKPFLKWLKNEKNDFLTWDQVKERIANLSEYLVKSLSPGDRCVLLSEINIHLSFSLIVIFNLLDNF